MTTGNFLWQAFTERRWWTAAERSYFQGLALLTYIFL